MTVSSPQPPRIVRLTIPSINRAEKQAMSAAVEAASLAGVKPERADEIRTAVSEACLNAMKHGNQMDKTAVVEVVIESTATSLCIDVWDEGRAEPPPASAFELPDMSTAFDGSREPGGMGLFVIRSFADSAGFVTPSGDGRRNRFRMIFSLEADK